MAEDSASRIETLRNIPTPNLADAMDRIGLSGAMDGIGILSHGMGRMAGRARTILQGPRRIGAGADQSFVRHIEMVDKVAQPGDVIIIGLVGEIAASSWGHLLSLRARGRGAVGTIVDGPVRDPQEIIKLGYPVFSRHTNCSAGSKFRLETIAFDQPVFCGGLQVRSGDFIVGDDSGVVVIPPDRAAEVIEIAKQIGEWEEQMLRKA